MSALTLTFTTSTDLTAAEQLELAARIGEAGNRELLRYAPAAGPTRAVEYVLVSPAAKG